MIDNIKKIKEEMGDRLIILAHHYQNDAIVSLADAVGDSLKLAQLAKANKTAEYIVFCGVHFMAETADILTEDNRKVFLPVHNAGCPMADMANAETAARCMELLEKDFGKNSVLPITYVNSKAEVKAFCGSCGGTVVTSGNAKNIVKWAFSQNKVVLFLPDQNLGRNTAADLGIKLEEMAVYNCENNELSYNCNKNDIKIVLWGGYCHVHHNISDETFKAARKNYPDHKIIVHPECRYEIASQADGKGSTEYIINTVKNSPAGSKFIIGTEKNLVNRLIAANPDKDIKILDSASVCGNMNKITVQSLCDTLKEVQNGNFARRVSVDKSIANNAKTALNKMLSLS